MNRPGRTGDGAAGGFGGTWLASLGDAAPSEFESRLDAGAGPPSQTAAPGSALLRIVRTYVAARAGLGVALVVGLGATNLLSGRVLPESVLVCIAYAVQAIALWLLPRFRRLTSPQPSAQRVRRLQQWLATIGVDLAAFSTLHLLESAAHFNFVALLVLPVLMAGVLTSRLVALATASGVALMLLAVAWSAQWSGGDSASLVTQSGLAGIGFFVIALLSGELAGRLAREEMAARGSLELARQQGRLNRLVLEEMADGVLVVDRRLHVRTANPAARSLLVAAGLAPTAPFALRGRAAWAALADAVEQALAENRWPEAGRDLTLNYDSGDTRSLRVRVRFTRRRDHRAGDGADEELAVVLLEDLRSVQARVRQEKLAAMGRVSAGIAHELRNPLAAIAQANALLMEDPLPAPQARLAQMVAENVERLKRIVDDVMEVATGGSAADIEVDAANAVPAIAHEWARTMGLEAGRDARLRLDVPPRPLPVQFDPEHLRRVLVNLLDNAKRHATEAPAAIGVRLATKDDAAALLLVESDGPAIVPEVERYLFEPFFSTRSRGSGLGLYICRELCERYGASIEYRLRPAGDRHRNLFIVTLRRNAAAVVDTPPRPSR